MIEEDCYCQCGSKMKRAGIFEDGKFKLTRCRICPSCSNTINGGECSSEDNHNKNEEEPYVKVSRILAENRNFKDTVCLPEKQSSRIEKLERRILFDDLEPLDILEKIKRIPIRDRPILTEPERLFENLCRKYHLPFKYVGNQRKKGELNPDFIHTSKKMVVEIMGDYWHSPLLNFKLKLKECTNLNYRKKYYKTHNLVSVFIWEADLKRDDAEQFVLGLLEREL